MVTNFSTKKYDLEHYALSDEVDVFFKSLPPFSENGHLFLSIFEKGTSRVEIFIHHHLFGIRPAFLWRVCDHYAIKLSIYLL